METTLGRRESSFLLVSLLFGEVELMETRSSKGGSEGGVQVASLRRSGINGNEILDKLNPVIRESRFSSEKWN